MSECKKCGREDGHYLGCPKVAVAFAANGGVDVTVEPSDFCAFDGCTNPKRPKGKGPAPKYCTEHSDPKNRK